jgi:hypothetical protein
MGCDIRDVMSRERQDVTDPKRVNDAASREARLERELRASLLKRKEQARTRQSSTTPPQRRGQTET